MDSDSSDTDSLEEWLHIPNPATHPLEAADWVCNSDFTHSLRYLKEAQAASLASQSRWRACLLEHALKCMEILELLPDTSNQVKCLSCSSSCVL